MTNRRSQHTPIFTIIYYFVIKWFTKYYYLFTISINNLIINLFSANFTNWFSINLFNPFYWTFSSTNQQNYFNTAVSNLSLSNTDNHNLFSKMEDSNSFRALSFNTPRIGIDFKYGFYNKCWKNYSMLFSTEGETKVLKNILKGSWIFSNSASFDYDRTLNGFYFSFTELFDETYRLWVRHVDEFKKTGRWNPPIFKDVVRPRWSQVSGDHGNEKRFESATLLPADAFFNLYQTNNRISNNLNIRWPSVE